MTRKKIRIFLRAICGKNQMLNERRIAMFLGILLFLSFVLPFAQAEPATGVVNASDGVPIHYAVQGKGDPAFVLRPRAR